MSNILRRFVSQNVIRNARQSHDYHVPANFKRSTMDDLPVPNGSWQEDFNAKNAKYNRHLIIGTISFVVTMIAANASGKVFFNFSPPPLPGKE